MKINAHFRWGYIAQIASVFTLGLINVVLPNWLGVGPYARFTEFLAYIGLTSTMFHEGVTLLTIQRIMQAGLPSRESSAVALQAVFEHVLLVLLVLSVVVLMTVAISPDLHYTISDWALVAATALGVAAYAPFLAWMTAIQRNDLVAQLTLIHGTLSFILPITLYSVGVDVRWSVLCSYLVVLVICLGTIRSVGLSWEGPSLSSERLVCLRWTIIATSAPTIMSVGLLSLPVMVLSMRQEMGAIAAYKIGFSLAFGALMIVPFNRRTVLSLAHQDEKNLVGQLSEAAVLISAAGAVVLIGLAEPLTHLLYDPGFSALAHMLPAFAFFIVLQIVADTLLVRAMVANVKSVLFMSFVIAIISMFVAVAVAPVQWVPALTLCSFMFSLVVPLYWKRVQLSTLPLRSGGLGLLACFMAAFIGQPMGVGLAIATLGMGTLANAGLRRSAVVMLNQLLSSRA